MEACAASAMQPIGLRLTPQQDLKAELDQFVQQQAIEAACVLSGVGSLTVAHLRFAGSSVGQRLEGPFEIVSLSGLLSRHGSHYHIAIADGQGQTIGGHLLGGSLIYTTAEIVLGVLSGVSFRREPDAETGYRELALYPTQIDRKCGQSPETGLAEA